MADAMMIPIRLERREPDHNRLRFYTITVTRTLFDGWALVREWGRIGQPGTVRATWFETEAAAIEAGEGTPAVNSPQWLLANEQSRN